MSIFKYLQEYYWAIDHIYRSYYSIEFALWELRASWELHGYSLQDTCSMYILGTTLLFPVLIENCRPDYKSSLTFTFFNCQLYMDRYIPVLYFQAFALFTDTINTLLIASFILAWCFYRNPLLKERSSDESNFSDVVIEFITELGKILKQQIVTSLITSSWSCVCNMLRFQVFGTSFGITEQALHVGNKLFQACMFTNWDNQCQNACQWRGMNRKYPSFFPYMPHNAFLKQICCDRQAQLIEHYEHRWDSVAKLAFSWCIYSLVQR
jgi:hypothetical protein